jgi:hypothetical protein
MSIQVTIDFEQLIRAVVQLSPQQKVELLRHIQENQHALPPNETPHSSPVTHVDDAHDDPYVESLLEKSNRERLTVEEKLALFDAMVIHVGQILPGYSDRREDMYGDDGR